MEKEGLQKIVALKTGRKLFSNPVEGKGNAKESSGISTGRVFRKR